MECSRQIATTKPKDVTSDDVGHAHRWTARMLESSRKATAYAPVNRRRFSSGSRDLNLNHVYICSVFGCSSRTGRDRNVSFFSFSPPKQREVGKVDCSNLPENWKPNQHSRICSKHFVEGRYKVIIHGLCEVTSF